jgi:hypothetical protein
MEGIAPGHHPHTIIASLSVAEEGMPSNAFCVVLAAGQKADSKPASIASSL